MQIRFRAAIIGTTRVQTIPVFCQAFCGSLASPSVVLARIWLTDKGGNLRLAGSAGAPMGGGTYTRLDGAFSRIARGAGKIGQIADTRAPLVIRGIRGDEDWIANPGWLARQGVRAFLGYPLIAGGEAVGVMAVFDRTIPADGMLEELQFLADYAAQRLQDLREREAMHPSASAVARATFPASFGETSPERPEGREGGPSALSAPAFARKPDASFGGASSGIVTRAELRAFEKQTIEAALAASNGKVFGPGGAAALLGMKPTTLASRIKALGLR